MTDRRRASGGSAFAILAALTALAILIQAVLAGEFIDRTGRGGWINAHALNADIVAVLALVTAACAMTTLRHTARELAIGSTMLAVLVIIQLVIGHEITNHNNDSLIAVHVPLAMAIFGLSVWINIRHATAPGSRHEVALGTLPQRHAQPPSAQRRATEER